VVKKPILGTRAQRRVLSWKKSQRKRKKVPQAKMVFAGAVLMRAIEEERSEQLNGS